MPYFSELDQPQVKTERDITGWKKVFLQGVSQWLETERIAAEQNKMLQRQVWWTSAWTSYRGFCCQWRAALFEGPNMKWALEEVAQDCNFICNLLFSPRTYSSLKYFSLLSALRPCRRLSGYDKKWDHDRNEVILFLLSFSVFLVLPKEIFRLKKQTKPPVPGP